MNRITSAINRLQRSGEKGFIPFFTAGYPDLKSTPAIFSALEQAGADIIEIGMPFSDPLADGSTIQASSYEAITSGTTPESVFNVIENIRASSELPIILFTYTNLILKFGVSNFMKTIAEMGGDGLLVPDLPIEESSEFRKYTHKYNLRMIFLISPLTSINRMKKIEYISDDFVYSVAVTGVTGTRRRLFDQIEPYLNKVRRTLSKPFMVGFGVSNRIDARKIASLSDGIVVGSAIVKVIQQNRKSQNLIEKVHEFAAEIHEGLLQDE